MTIRTYILGAALLAAVVGGCKDPVNYKCLAAVPEAQGYDGLLRTENLGTDQEFKRLVVGTHKASEKSISCRGWDFPGATVSADITSSGQTTIRVKAPVGSVLEKLAAPDTLKGLADLVEQRSK